MDFHRELPVRCELELNREVKPVKLYGAFLGASDSTNAKPLSLPICHREAWQGGTVPASSRQSLSDEHAAVCAPDKSQPAENAQ